jgi:hypothetical protein
LSLPVSSCGNKSFALIIVYGLHQLCDCPIFGRDECIAIFHDG